jgi:hypothetical protein
MEAKSLESIAAEFCSERGEQPARKTPSAMLQEPIPDCRYAFPPIAVGFVAAVAFGFEL